MIIGRSQQGRHQRRALGLLMLIALFLVHQAQAWSCCVDASDPQTVAIEKSSQEADLPPCHNSDAQKVSEADTEAGTEVKTAECCDQCSQCDSASGSGLIETVSYQTVLASSVVVSDARFSSLPAILTRLDRPPIA